MIARNTNLPIPDISSDFTKCAADRLASAAIDYHRRAVPGKVEIRATKPLVNQRDLALAYSPAVAAPCEAILADPTLAAELTARQNLVAVLTNGTAVLGLGDIGPLASKPVMEGKAVLFKKFAGVDAYDIELAEKDVGKLATIVRALEPTFGGINLEDIKSPECFELEEALQGTMSIPVFHEDQHGTAIIVGAVVINALKLAGKSLEDVKIVTSGAGAAALACLNLLISLGARRENIWLTDIKGVVYAGRTELVDRWKAAFAQDTDYRSLSQVLVGADIFLGVSAASVLKPEFLIGMAPSPLIMALANPVPEIMPELITKERPDALICTGRSDYPNQVNNVLCFPHVFRGALDCGAVTINEDMKGAAVEALAALARETPSDVVALAYGGEMRPFGPNALIPSPFDPRLILRIAPAVAKAAMRSGVATRPIEDIEAYREKLSRFVYRSGFLMKPVFTRAKAAPKRVIFSDGQDERVLRAAQVIVEEGIAFPILVGRPDVITARIERYALTLRPFIDFDLINPQDDPRYRDYVATYLEKAERRGVTPNSGRTLVRTNSTLIAVLAVARGDADAVICGLEGSFRSHLEHIESVIGLLPGGLKKCAALSLLITSKGPYFVAGTHVQHEPDAEGIADIALACADHARRFGLPPRIALLSHSDFGASNSTGAVKMRSALGILRRRTPELEVDGEMQAETALSALARDRAVQNSHLHGDANILVMPGIDAANIAFQFARALTDGLPVGPILLGPARPAHILTPSVTSRGVVNLAAIAVVEAQAHSNLPNIEISQDAHRAREDHHQFKEIQ